MMKYLLGTAAAVALIAGTTFAASDARAEAQNCEIHGNNYSTDTTTTVSDPTYYHGYGSTPASGPGNGTSTVVISTATTTQALNNPNCAPLGTKTVTTTDYTDGPGKSPYDSHDSSTCDATGTLSCP